MRETLLLYLRETVFLPAGATGFALPQPTSRSGPGPPFALSASPPAATCAPWQPPPQPRPPPQPPRSPGQPAPGSAPGWRLLPCRPRWHPGTLRWGDSVPRRPARQPRRLPVEPVGPHRQRRGSHECAVGLRAHRLLCCALHHGFAQAASLDSGAECRQAGATDVKGAGLLQPVAGSHGVRWEGPAGAGPPQAIRQAQRKLCVVGELAVLHVERAAAGQSHRMDQLDQPGRDVLRRELEVGSCRVSCAPVAARVLVDGWVQAEPSGMAQQSAACCSTWGPTASCRRRRLTRSPVAAPSTAPRVAPWLVSAISPARARSSNEQT